MNRPRRRGCGIGCLVTLLVFLLLAAVFALATRYVYRMPSRGGTPPPSRPQRAELWGEGVQLPQVEPDTTLPDRTALAVEQRARNEDTVGWLYIPDTGIDFAVVHTPNVNNLYNHYLDHNIDGESDANGACFADMRARFGGGSRGKLSPLTTLYAHSFREDPAHDSPFSPLKYYRDEAFARAHPYLYFSTWQENMAFEVISVFEAHINLPYNHCDQTVQEFESMLDAVFRSSLYDYGASVAQTDRLLVLSTCAMTVQGHESLDPYTTDYRFVVMGKLVPPGEAVRTEASFSVNGSPAPPDDFLHMGWN